MLCSVSLSTLQLAETHATYRPTATSIRCACIAIVGRIHLSVRRWHEKRLQPSRGLRALLVVVLELSAVTRQYILVLGITWGRVSPVCQRGRVLEHRLPPRRHPSLPRPSLRHPSPRPRILMQQQRRCCQGLPQKTAWVQYGRFGRRCHSRWRGDGHPLLNRLFRLRQKRLDFTQFLLLSFSFWPSACGWKAAYPNVVCVV